jgi:hypothetical protein
MQVISVEGFTNFDDGMIPARRGTGDSKISINSTGIEGIIKLIQIKGFFI